MESSTPDTFKNSKQVHQFPFSVDRYPTASGSPQIHHHDKKIENALFKEAQEAFIDAQLNAWPNPIDPPMNISEEWTLHLWPDP